MMTSETHSHDISIALIDVPEDRARDLDPAWVEALAGIIQAQGLLNPITLRAVGERFALVAGLHRLEAMRSLDRAAIPARLADVASDDEARLIEVMENLGRNELIALDRCHHLYELKQVWGRMYPQAVHGGDRRSIKRQSLPLDPNAPEIFGFAKATAEKVGLSERAIRLAVKIWTSLTPEARRRLAGTDLARKQTELKALSELTPAMQGKVLDAILGDGPAENVAQALDLLDTGVKPDAQERRFVAFSEAFKKLADPDLDRLLVEQEDRVIASLRRRGRI